jgi:23S rRNA pseudouridine2605 synthase
MRKKPSSAGRKSDSGKSYKKNASDKRGGADRKSFNKEGGSGRPFENRSADKGDRPAGSRSGYKSKRPYTGRDNSGGDEDRTKKPYSGRDTGKSFDNDHPKRSYSDDKPKRPYGDRDKKGFDSDRPKRSYSDDKPKRPYGDRDKKGFDSDRPKRAFSDDKPKRPYGDRNKEGFDNDRPKRSFSDDKPKRPYDDRDKKGFDSDRPKRAFSDDKPKRPYGDRDKKGFDNDRPKRAFSDDRPKRPYGDRDKKGFDSDRPKRSYSDDKPKRPYSDKKKDFDSEKPARSRRDDDKPKRPFSETLDKAFIDPDRKRPFDDDQPKGPAVNKKIKELDEDKPGKGAKDETFERKVSGPFRKKFKEDFEKFDREERFYKNKGFEEETDAKEMTLNKYISHSSTSSRRDAAELVKQGKVKVNGELMLDPGYRVQPYDKVTIAGKKLTPQRDRAYVLLNKPKGYITTTEDPEGRKTVMELVQGTGYDRLYPVGRLDRNTTGLLLLTNDGDLAQKLSHPSYETKKVYQVSLNKALAKTDFDKITAGLELEDGPVVVDEIAYLDDKSEIGIEIHSGRNRIVRRIFESLGYEVEKLDRVMYAGLTKKNLPRGKWRLLDDKEIILLKHFKS